MKPHLLAILALLLWGAQARADLVAYFPFDSDFTDASGMGNHLLAGAGTPSVTTAAGEFAFGTGALDLDSTTANQEYLNLTTPLSFGAGDAWSVVFWSRTRPGADDRTGMIVGDLGNDDFIWVPRDGAVDGLRLRNSAGSNADYNNGVQPSGEFHHWAVVADGSGNVEVFYDNASLGTRSVSTIFDITSVGQAFNNTVQSMDGQIDELYIYDEAITATKIDELYQMNNLPPPPPPPEPASRLRVFLLGGQSNADGRGNPSGLPTAPIDLQSAQDDVDFYEGAGGPLMDLQPGSLFGPEITMGRRLADLTGGEAGSRIAILKYASGGTDLKNQWKAGGDATTSGDGPQYVTFQTTVTNGLAALAAAHPGASIELEGMLWVQGERDARLGYEDEYEANLTAFIADVRLTYGAELPFVVMRLSSGQTDLPAAGLAGVRAAQTTVASADDQTELIDSDLFGLLSDDLHFDALGQQQIGTASANALASFFPMGAATLSPDGMGDLEIEVTGAFAGFLYTLQSNTSLGPAGWQDLETVAATGDSVVFSYTPPPADLRRFFRVIRTPPP